MTAMTATFILLKASLLLSAAATANAVFGRRRSAAIRHLVWTLAVLALLLLPILSVLLPGWTVIRLTIASPITRAIPRVEPGPGSAMEFAAVDRSREAATTTASARSTTAGPANRLRWSSALLLIYAAGVVLFLARVGVQLRSARRLVGRASDVRDPEWTRLLQECAATLGLRRPVRLMRSGEEAVPVAVGTLHGVILMPAVADTWSDGLRRAVLLHELAHVARYDCLTQTLAAIVCAVYWIHPGVWWMSRRLRVERELACDDRVLSSGTGPRGYARHLLELAHSHVTPALTAGMAGSGQLERRLVAMLDAERSRTPPPLRTRLAGATIMTVLLVPMSAATARLVSPDEVPKAAAARTSGSTGLPVTDTPVHTEALLPVSAATTQGVSLGAHARAVAEAASNSARREPAQSVTTPSGEDRLLGLWEFRPTTTGLVGLRLCYAELFARPEVPLEQLEGLSAAGFPGVEGPIRFRLQRDAGTFLFDGTVEQGAGEGTYVFEPAAPFAAALQARGLEGLTPSQQLAMAQHGIDLASLDELSLQGDADLSHVAWRAQIHARLEDLVEAVAGDSASISRWC